MVKTPTLFTDFLGFTHNILAPPPPNFFFIIIIKLFLGSEDDSDVDSTGIVTNETEKTIISK